MQCLVHGLWTLGRFVLDVLGSAEKMRKVLRNASWRLVAYAAMSTLSVTTFLLAVFVGGEVRAYALGFPTTALFVLVCLETGIRGRLQAALPGRGGYAVAVAIGVGLVLLLVHWASGVRGYSAYLVIAVTSIAWSSKTAFVSSRRDRGSRPELALLSQKQQREDRFLGRVRRR